MSVFTGNPHEIDSGRNPVQIELALLTGRYIAYISGTDYISVQGVNRGGDMVVVVGQQEVATPRSRVGIYHRSGGGAGLVDTRDFETVEQSVVSVDFTISPLVATGLGDAARIAVGLCRLGKDLAHHFGSEVGAGL